MAGRTSSQCSRLDGEASEMRSLVEPADFLELYDLEWKLLVWTLVLWFPVSAIYEIVREKTKYFYVLEVVVF